MTRHKNTNWDLPGPKVETWEQASVAVLMDIRDELQTLNRLLSCTNFINIPHKLDDIRTAVKRTDKRLTKKVPLR